MGHPGIVFVYMRLVGEKVVVENGRSTRGTIITTHTKNMIGIAARI